jgi:formate hydrogenlyase subunit 3/multisubunit Na+/H+ antiporter MnhD subunit
VQLLSIAILLIVATGIASGIISLASKSKANRIGLWGIVIGCILGLAFSLAALLSASREVILLQIPFSRLHLTFFLDPLSSFFLVLIFLLSLLCAIYGDEYLQVHGNNNKLWFLYNLLAASMVLVAISGDAISFLVFWELMALSSFFLVAQDWDNAKSSRASWIYLSFTQIGTAALLVFFLFLWKKAGTADFESFKAVQLGGSSGFLFVLALIGFGSKAGIVPFHIWLPEAHPAAPSHVSALMSGIMIKIGIYGLLRALTFLGTPDIIWGASLIAIGALSGILGVLLAIAQHDIKRLLAYHSVENIGIIVVGIGIGVLGLTLSSPLLATLGFAGGLLHVLNHAFFKGLLFLSAGSVISKTHTREINQMGGLIKVMPLTALAFLIGSLAITGIPPFNGFVSEFLIYGASFSGLNIHSIAIVMILTCAILSLAFIGGLALLCFTKAFGIVFLGESRRVDVAGLNENRIKMTFPMMTLSFLCVAIGIVPVLVLPLMKGPLQMLCHVPGVDLCEFSRINSFCTNLTVAALSFSAILGLVLLGRRLLAQGKSARTEVTWDCGFFKSSPRLQYTASSFAYPIVEFFSGILRTKKHGPPIHGYFPARTSLNTHTSDIAVRHFYAPFYRLTKTISSGVVNRLYKQDHLSKTIYRRVKSIFKLLRTFPLWIKTRIFLLLTVMRRWLSMIRVIQHGDIRIYLLYIVAALCVLLILT